MKTRQGFVSNSSSSSFIIGAGRIKRNKLSEFKKWFENLNYPTSENFREVGIANTSEILRGHNIDTDNIRVDNDSIIEVDEYLVVRAPVNDFVEISIFFDREKKANYFFVCIGNDEGDDAFWDEKYEELDYDRVDDNWFSGKQKEILNVLKSGNFFNEVTVKIGADRNG